MEALSGCSDQASFRIAALSRCFRKQPTTERSPLASTIGEGRGQAGRVGQYRSGTIIIVTERHGDPLPSAIFHENIALCLCRTIMLFSSTRPTKGRWCTIQKAACRFPRISGSTRPKPSVPTRHCGPSITEDSAWCPPACTCSSSRLIGIT